jgi:hypothetical protein
LACLSIFNKYCIAEDTGIEPVSRLKEPIFSKEVPYHSANPPVEEYISGIHFTPKYTLSRQTACLVVPCKESAVVDTASLAESLNPRVGTFRLGQLLLWYNK